MSGIEDGWMNANKPTVNSQSNGTWFWLADLSQSTLVHVGTAWKDNSLFFNQQEKNRDKLLFWTRSLLTMSPKSTQIMGLNETLASLT